MIKAVNEMSLTNQCDNCGQQLIHDLTGKVMKLDAMTQTYENLHVHCTCGAIAVINMNIPVDDELYLTGTIPEDEEVNRYYARLLIRMVREDFVSL